jgi:hypothetical protein
MPMDMAGLVNAFITHGSVLVLVFQMEKGVRDFGISLASSLRTCEYVG